MGGLDITGRRSRALNSNHHPKFCFMETDNKKVSIDIESLVAKKFSVKPNLEDCRLSETAKQI